MQFFNTLSRQVEEFTPREPGKVGLYTCGPTIYDYAHIGNFRTYVFEDLLRRYLKYRGLEVFQVMNLTDVEDKIIRKSIEAGMNFREYTKVYAEAFFEDLKRLNIEPAEEYPRATESVDKMAEIIRKLLADGVAYRSEDGSIYYNIARFADYGKLANIEVDQLQAGARVCQDEYEKDRACDFALWKAWDPADGEVYWDQYPDLGKGRPGWHIECSAMSIMHLGPHFDIHTGGVDNIFPHHQNEIAQSEAYTGVPFVNYWLHSEHLLVDNEKMSKKLGNFFTIRDLLDPQSNPAARAFDPMVIRYELIRVNYRSRLNFRFEGLAQAERSLERITDFLRRCSNYTEGAGGEERVEQCRAGFVQALDDDLNISEGLARVFDLITDLNIWMDKKQPLDGRTVIAWFDELDQVLGLKLRERWAPESLPPELMELVERRAQARKDKDWPLADQYRKQLLEAGLVVEDTPQGARWKRV